MNRIELVNFVEKNLKNTRGNIEGQRISEKWFTKRGFIKEWEFFKSQPISNSQQLYMFIHDDTGICVCGQKKRFVGFNEGFKEYCESCARSKNNWTKHPKTTTVHLNELVDFVKVTSGYSTSRIKKLSQQTISQIIERTNYLTDCSLTERIYHIEHNLYNLPKCKKCGEPNDNFRTSKVGYFPYCKNNCSYNYNKEERKNSLKTHFYNKYINKFQSNDEYDIRLFSLDDYLNGNHCVVKFKHLVCGHKYDLDIKYQGHYKCPMCYPIRSRKQYELYNWVNQFTKCNFNDRQFIKPLEIDILADTFAIEYDSLMFHSFGNSELKQFNNPFDEPNCHLNKSELVESNNLQLFRVFSNEWINNEDIWKSIILSKLNSTSKIYARNCQIREVDNNTSKEFLVKNHLQGSINSSHKFGLYYNDELVSLMTFGRARRSKWKGCDNFELLRFCTKLNYTVVGGASKLLKYFERNYKPNLLVSYANRRWSQGNVYEKLGFKFIENTPPNYFYFKGGDGSKLLSREQFQKHKLKTKLEIFDPNLTETQNMYNNNYRKIYDCGNKVYIKQY